jgi:di/tricarboxylate transporter
MFGGVCTLLGTSTNILVSSIAVENGLPAFSMFEFAPFGLIIVAAGFVYLFAVGIKMVPPRRKLEDLTQSFRMNEYLSEVKILGGHPFIGGRVGDLPDLWTLDAALVQLHRDGELVENFRDETLREGDVLRIRANPQQLDRMVRHQTGLEILPAKQWEDADLSSGRFRLLEAVVAPDSNYDSRRIKSIDFFENYGAVVLGLYKQGGVRTDELSRAVLRGGDSLLLALGKARTPNLKNDPNFVIVSEVVVERFLTRKIPLALGILALVVLAAALNLVPIALSAVTGVLLMIITGCLRPEQVYRAINWKVIFLLAGVIPLGVAMQKTGAARLLSGFIVDSVGDMGPRAVLSGYFLLTMVLTAMISNQATAAILASLAIETAGVLDVAARPFLMAITFAASLSFITPWGYQTNTLIYGPGQYKFTDFTKVGLPLNLLFWILGTLLIPVIWNF